MDTGLNLYHMTNEFTFTHISIDQTDVSRKMFCCVGVSDAEALCCVDRSVAGEAAWLRTLDSRVHGYWLPLASPTPPVIRTHVSYTAVIHKRGSTVSEIHSLQNNCHNLICTFQLFS